MRRRCVWCHEWLRYRTGKGWVHERTGAAVVTRVDAEGQERDDHVALPDLSS